LRLHYFKLEKLNKEQIGGDIYNILEKLRNIIHGDMECQAYYIQVLLADELDQYKGKENEKVKSYIKMIQDVY